MTDFTERKSENYACMICGSTTINASEEDQNETEYWTYCRKCDCWTSHPIKKP